MYVVSRQKSLLKVTHLPFPLLVAVCQYLCSAVKQQRHGSELQTRNDSWRRQAASEREICAWTRWEEGEGGRRRIGEGGRRKLAKQLSEGRRAAFCAGFVPFEAA